MEFYIKIGLTGGIGAGKSVVSKLLKNMGYPVFDTDKEAKILMDESPIIVNALKDKYGEEVYQNNKLNREFLASKIFADKDNLTFVNNLVHPLVKDAFEAWVKKQKSRIVFLESAILYESGFDRFMNYVWFVKASKELRANRVVKRDNCTADDVEKRINSQMDDSLKEKKASVIIQNDEQTAIIPQIIYSINNVIESNN
ncbi:MAG: dephospho-CoA kinase [Bacteroidales bacterium]|nr:dephospho-CoA kinase [Bacteroidales bacterium]